MTPKPGYKHTDVGLIPEDWEVKHLKDIAIFRRGSFPQPYGLSKWYDQINGKPFAQVFDIDSNMKIKEDTKFRISKLAQNMSVLAKKGTVILTIQGSIGRVAITQYDVFIDRTLLIFESYLTKINSVYFSFMMKVLFEREKEKAPGGIIKTITKEALSVFSIPLPPLAEQEKIAAALSDMDALIARLEAVLAKKRMIKQGAMQELLRPKDGWEVKRLGECLRILHGKSQHEVKDEQGEYPIIASGGIIGYSKKFMYNKPSVLIGRKGTIDEPQYMDKPFWAIDTIFHSEIFESYNAKFIFYIFKLIDWYSHNEASGVPSLNAKVIEGIVSSFPPLAEQERIAAILSEMDAELALLEARLAKYRHLKQGMMQQLLTGAVRLI